MAMKASHRALRIAAGLSSLAALGIFASSASAVCPVGSVCTSGEVVAGTTLSSIALSASGTVGTPVAFTNFAPGNTATGSGALTAVDTNPTWTLQVQDLGTGAGKMVQTGGTCTGSAAQTTNALKVGVTAPTSGLPTGTGVTVNPAVTLSGTVQTLATNTTGTGGQLLNGNVFTSNYSLVIPTSQVMAAGCVYGLTATYTLQ
jgi:hypothetical protein